MTFAPRRTRVFAVLGLFVAWIAPHGAAAQTPPRPNVVIILADDNCYATGRRNQEMPRKSAFFKGFVPVSWR